MRTQSTRWLAPWGGLCALLIGPVAALAHSGQPPTGPPTTAPKVNDQVPDRGTKTAAPRVTSEVLPPVPATARDPAPPGTRAVRVDTPVPVDSASPAAATVAPGAGRVPAGAVAPVPAAAPATAPVAAAAHAAPGVQVAEGVVTKLLPPHKELAQERLRFVLDPSQDWNSFVSRGPVGLPVRERTTGRASQNEPRGDGASESSGRAGDRVVRTEPTEAGAEPGAPDQAPGLEMAVTQRTYVYAFARTPEGFDYYGGGTASAPEDARDPRFATPGPKPTNFTNVREGSFVAVRFRRTGDDYEVVNLSLIELPILPPAGSVPAGTAAPAATATPTRPAA
ncbi:MAG TPA: hypothetical protein VF590_15015, partial [Isosphaeraceae bacterium]